MSRGKKFKLDIDCAIDAATKEVVLFEAGVAVNTTTGLPVAAADELCRYAANVVKTAVEGPLTAIPTAVADPTACVYKFKMDTSAGDIDLTGLGAIAGVNEGDKVVFCNDTGGNELLYGVSATADKCPMDWLELTWCDSAAEWIEG